MTAWRACSYHELLLTTHPQRGFRDCRVKSYRGVSCARCGASPEPILDVGRHLAVGRRERKIWAPQEARSFEGSDWRKPKNVGQFGPGVWSPLCCRKPISPPMSAFSNIGNSLVGRPSYPAVHTQVHHQRPPEAFLLHPPEPGYLLARG